jgi:tetratricopeptide (TPR) repeat protein
LRTTQAKKLATENQWTAVLALLDRLLTQPLADRWIPDLLEAYLLRSEAHQRLEQPDQAIGDLDTVLQVDPLHIRALVARGKLNRAQLHESRAKADLGHACLLGSTEACEQLP